MWLKDVEQILVVLKLLPAKAGKFANGVVPYNRAIEKFIVHSKVRVHICQCLTFILWFLIKFIIKILVTKTNTKGVGQKFSSTYYCVRSDN